MARTEGRTERKEETQVILKHKKTGKLYNYVGIEDNGLELTLVLEHWHKTPKGAYRKAKRSATVYSWEDLIDQMNAFEETSFGKITATDVKRWLNEEQK